MAPVWFDRVRERLGLEVETEPAEASNPTLLSRLNEATTLDRTQRAIGFAICAGLGLLLCFLAPAFLFRPVKFALLYSLGNLLAVGSSLFLAGPTKQLTNMFHTKRRVATIVFLGSIIGTLISAMVVHSAILCLVFIALQTAALLWYCLSYVPFAQSFVLRLAGRNLDTSELDTF